MKLTLARSTLVKALGQVARIVERRTTIPILSNLALRSDGDALVITATDLDMTATVRLEAEVAEPGATTLPAALLHDLARKLPESAAVVLALPKGGSVVEITSGRSRFKVNCLPVEDFPDLEAGELPTRFAISAAALVQSFGRCSFAMSTEETRYYLNGIYWHAAAVDNVPKLRAVATDGHRLALVDLVQPEGAAAMPGVILPRKTVAEVMRLAGVFEGDVAVSLSTTKIRFEIGALMLTSKLVDGTYPDYQRVIPAGNDKVATCDRAAFLGAAERVAAISAERKRQVKLSFGESECHLDMNSPDQGQASEAFEIGYDATPQEIGFNVAYLAEILGMLPGDSITLAMGAPADPALLRSVGDPSLQIVLMPMRV